MIKALKKGWSYKWIVFFCFFALLPVVAVSKYNILFANEILIMSLFAIAFNLLFGYTGMLSFGQATFYGIGAYSVGILMTKAQCPFVLSILIGIILSALTALVIGSLCIHRKGIFFTMLTLAFGQLIWGITFKWYAFTGGDNGIQGIPVGGFLGSTYNYYYFSLVVVFISLLICNIIVRSPFGCILNCIRQNSERTEFIGIKIRRYQLAIYVISAVFSAMAGVLFAGFEHSVHPNILHWTKSGEVILMSIAGGFLNFCGPIIGAVVVILIEDIIGAHTEYWSFFMGISILLVVLLFPSGIVGSASSYWGKIMKLYGRKA